MSQKNQVQNYFLEYICTNKLPLTIFLGNGIKLSGLLEDYDDTCVMLKRNHFIQIIYKHSISTILPTNELPDFNIKGTD